MNRVWYRVKLGYILDLTCQHTKCILFEGWGCTLYLVLAPTCETFSFLVISYKTEENDGAQPSWLVATFAQGEAASAHCGAAPAQRGATPEGLVTFSG